MIRLTQTKKSLAGKRILITSGPTAVGLDPMRVISNRATGELGQKIAVALSQIGAKVTLLQGAVAQQFQAKSIRIKRFYFYDELAALLKTELKKKYDAVIHNAAVSDYQLKKPFASKLDSDKKTLTITLVPTKKLISTIKVLAPKTFLVGFKLEDFKNEKDVVSEAQKLIANSQCDLVVANTLKGGYKATVLDRDAKICSHAYSRSQLTKNLVCALKENLSKNWTCLPPH